MPLKQSQRVCLAGAIFMLLFGGASMGYAAECKTSSGSECKVSCSTGTATATCSINSKICSTSCSDDEGNMEINLIRSIQIVTEGRVDREEAEYLLRGEVNAFDMFHYGDRTNHIQTYYGVIIINVGRPQHR